MVRLFFECPLIHSPCREFFLLIKLDICFQNGTVVPSKILHCLLLVFVKAQKLENALASLALHIREYRQKWFPEADAAAAAGEARGSASPRRAERRSSAALGWEVPDC